MVQRQQAGSLVSFCVFDILACLFGRPFFFDSRHYFWFWFWTQFWVSFLPLFFGGATKERNWRPLKTGAKIVPQIGLKIQPKKFDSLKQTNADIKDAEIDLACCRSTIASLWRSRRALDQISKTLKKERMEHIANERVQSSNKGAF